MTQDEFKGEYLDKARRSIEYESSGNLRLSLNEEQKNINSIKDSQDEKIKILVCRAELGDEFAFDDLRQALIPLSSYIARIYAKNDRELNEDLVADSLSHLISNISKFNFKYKFINWAGAVMRNKMRDDIRRIKRENERIGEIVDTLNGKSHTEHLLMRATMSCSGDSRKDIESREFERRMAECIEKLPTNKKMIFRYLFQGYKVNEIITLTGFKSYTIYQHIKEGRVILKNMMGI